MAVVLDYYESSQSESSDIDSTLDSDLEPIPGKSKPHRNFREYENSASFNSACDTRDYVKEQKLWRQRRVMNIVTEDESTTIANMIDCVQ